jgi:hypothetical protein
MSTNKRPSYTRDDTDIPRENRDESGSGSDQDKSEVFDQKALDDKGTPIGAPFGHSTGADLPAYDTDEFTRRRSTVVTTAEDLVTQVINVEDDPTQNPWTFRAFFLGTST